MVVRLLFISTLLRGILLKMNYKHKREDISNVLDALLETMEDYLIIPIKYRLRFAEARRFKIKLMEK